MKKAASFIILVALVSFFGCSHEMRMDPNYVAYLQAAKEQPKVIEITAQPGQTIELRGVERFTVYGPSGVKVEQRQPEQDAGATIAREFFGMVRSAVPYAFGGFAIDRITKFGSHAVDSAGHNTAISGSYNTNTDRHDVADSYNGDYRDIGSLADDHSNRSISDSYKDRHDISNAYNPVDYHGVVNTTEQAQ